MELPQLQKLYSKYHKSGLEVIAVSPSYNLEGQLKKIEEMGLNFIFLSDSEEIGESIEQKLYPTLGHPQSYIIGRDGRVYYFHYGFTSGDEVKIEQEITGLMKE